MTNAQEVADVKTAGNMLAMLASSIADVKEKQAAKLTPVAGEPVAPKAAPKGVTISFPWDEPIQEVQRIVAEMRKQANLLLEGAAALETALNLPRGDEKAVSEADRKRLEQAERERRSEAAYLASVQAERDAAEAAKAQEKKDETVNEDFAERMERLTADAKAQAFGWRCPTHAKAIQKTSRLGRKYVGCPECAECEPR